MRVLEFEVKEQLLRKKPGCDFSNIVARTEGYLRAKFHFSGEGWEGVKKAASFWYINNEYPILLDKEDSCMIPREALFGDKFFVSVTGASVGYMIKSTKIKVDQEVY